MEWLTIWNVSGTWDGAPYAGAPYFWQQLLAALFIRDDTVSGEGYDEIINWSSLCVDVETGEIVTARVDIEPFFKEVDGKTRSLNNGA